MSNMKHVRLALLTPTGEEDGPSILECELSRDKLAEYRRAAENIDAMYVAVNYTGRLFRPRGSRVMSCELHVSGDAWWFVLYTMDRTRLVTDRWDFADLDGEDVLADVDDDGGEPK